MNEYQGGLQPIIDADVLTYEVCNGVEYRAEYTPSFDEVISLLESKLRMISVECMTDERPLLFLTGEGNFRFLLAQTKPYKNRDISKRPYHYDNIRAYMHGVYGAEIVNGMEADDALCIEQYKRRDEVILCTRDKDLRQNCGWHFGWENGKQASFGPAWVSELGEWINGRVPCTGMRLFYWQLLVGDSVDNIPGLPKYGPVKATKILQPCNSIEELERAVYTEYEKVYGEHARDLMLEQGRLLWMIKQLDENDCPIHWELSI